MARRKSEPRDRKALEQARRDRGRFEPLRQVLEGAEAVYKEGSIYALVRLTNIEADDWGVKAKVEAIADLASDRPLGSGWDISAVWSILSFSAREWYARYVSWHIYLDKELVRAVKAKELDAIPRPAPAHSARLADRRAGSKTVGAAKRSKYVEKTIIAKARHESTAAAARIVPARRLGKACASGPQTQRCGSWQPTTTWAPWFWNVASRGRRCAPCRHPIRTW
jgi:hypothetical protein